MIIFIPWENYNAEDTSILDSNPDEEAVGCLAMCCGYIVSFIIYVLLFYLCCILTKDVLRLSLIMIDSLVIYPILMIYLTELSVKIGDKIIDKHIKRKENEKL